ncbi:MAG: hypothetical protein KF727_14430 [Microbacteriaceae bacterium]|nr:hypothetical protein [Microbacteriaceae bacterium]
MTDDTWVVVRVQGHHDQPFPSLRRLVATWNAHNADSRFSVREPGADFDTFPLDEGELEYDPHETRSASMSGRHNYEPDGLHEAAAAISRRFPLLEVEVGSAGETSNRYDVRYVAGERSAVRHGDGEWYPTKLLPLMAAVRAAIAEDGHGVLIDASRALVDAIDTAQGRTTSPAVASTVQPDRARGTTVHPIVRAQTLDGAWVSTPDVYLGISQSMDNRLMVVHAGGTTGTLGFTNTPDGIATAVMQVPNWDGTSTPVLLESVLDSTDWDHPSDLADVIATGSDVLEARFQRIDQLLNDGETHTAPVAFEAYRHAFTGIPPAHHSPSVSSTTPPRTHAGVVEPPTTGIER